MPNESAGAPPRDLPPELNPDFERFREALSQAVAGAGSGLDPVRDPTALGLWREYGRLLYEKAADLALIGKGDRVHVYTRHVLDSLNALTVFPAPPRSALDIGSGAGLPGIPLAIAWPTSQLVLLESRERKAGFLEQAVRTLGLRNVRVVCARLEDYGRSWTSGPFDAVLIRAIGELAVTLEHATKAATEGAGWVYFLGSRSPEEALDGESASAEVMTGAFGGRLLTGKFPRP